MRAVCSHGHRSPCSGRSESKPNRCSWNPGPSGLLAAAEEAALVVVGLPDGWRRGGLGAVRLTLVREAGPPVLVVRRGLRPGGLTPPEGLTRFTWSIADR